MNATAYLVALSALNKTSTTRMRALLDYFAGDAERAWLEKSRWREALSLHAGAEAELLSRMAEVDVAACYSAFLATGASLITWESPQYPVLLRQIYDPPYVLYCLGDLPKEEELCLALIGSRRATEYGRQVTAILARDLANAGACVVSGMARGIDSFAHRAA